MHPPAPVECPIGGIYNFTQIGVPEFKYFTKIRGVTLRPRVDYHCENIESEFKVTSPALATFTVLKVYLPKFLIV